MFLSSPTQNHAESLGNHPKKSFLNPKCNIFMKKSSFGHVRTCQGQSRRTSQCQQSGLPFFFQVTHVSQKSSFLTSRQHFLWKNRVLQFSGRDTLENTTKITSKTKFSINFVQLPSHLHPALSYSLPTPTKG